MAGDFRGAKLKIERAKQHINQINALGQIFLNTHPHVLSVKLNPETGKDILCIARAEPPPDEFVLILGDAVHNLRTALDHAWVQILTSPTRDSKFPFRETKQAFEAAIGGLKKREPAKRSSDS